MRRLQHSRMTRQPQVVVGAQHHHPLAVDHRLRSFVQLNWLKERVQTRRPGLVGELEVRDPLENVRRTHLALVSVHLLQAQAGGLR